MSVVQNFLDDRTKNRAIVRIISDKINLDKQILDKNFGRDYFGQATTPHFYVDTNRHKFLKVILFFFFPKHTLNIIRERTKKEIYFLPESEYCSYIQIP